jgi:hypothetical protein
LLNYASRLKKIISASQEISDKKIADQNAVEKLAIVNPEIKNEVSQTIKPLINK